MTKRLQRMVSLKRKRPSANSLVVFDVVSQNLSFTKAAEELGTTRVAVSGQVKILEEHLGVRLFERLHRRLKLTTAGETLADSVSRSFKDISIALDRVAESPRNHQLAISVSQGMSAHWLLPRIYKFRNQYPSVDIRFQITDGYVDLQTEGIDVALRYGDGPWKDVKATKLKRVRRFPVCSPDYLKKVGKINSLEDLSEHELLYLSGRYGKLTRWEEWLKMVGIDGVHTRHGLEFDAHNSLIEAVLAGQGIALAGPPQISQYLKDGKLVRLFKGIETKHRFFWIVEPVNGPTKPFATELATWLESEILDSVKNY
ncbi:MAG: LysR substrate-binding domain-containing protein [Gemmatimonadota bacterium]|nr:LysR substrate-binding domain-containing protein [Gemmatimonadota bacterium]MXY65570.1 LysR family transcriptional regulator [Gammaproteobacteria bacterium]MYG67477.1 LysR family transcriptional regulator [Gammaproteobacteria bacterium]